MKIKTFVSIKLPAITSYRILNVIRIPIPQTEWVVFYGFSCF